MSTHYTTGDVIDVRIEKIVPRGFGLGFSENLTVLVPLTAPGDELRVRIREIKKRMAFADIVEIRRGGPRRIAPPCPLFGTCGGCDFQQISYTAQLEAKVGLIRDCLHRIGKIEFEDDIPIIPSPSEFGYRSRARFHIDRDARTIGYYARDSHEVVNLTACPILTPGLQSTLDYIRDSMDWDLLWDDRSELEAATGDEGRVSIRSSAANEPSAELSFVSGGHKYLFSAEVFFQANKFLIPELIAAALGDARGELAFDLYCGVGLFSLPLASHFNKVLAVEEDPRAVEFAKKNLDAAHLANVKVVSKTVSKFLAENKTKKIDLVLIDPPRAGTEKGTMAAIAALKAPRVSYVSCEPSILARDLRVLLDAGYSIDKMTAIDLFPQTHHVETVVRLSLS